jgi:Lysozyme like domain
MLTPAQIQAVAANAGFSGADLATAVAIALAESNPSGNENSYNPETNAPGGTPKGQGSYGLWQIYLKMHPEFAGENLYDPQTNANAAYQIYSAAGGFRPWSTYGPNGKYLAYLSQVPASFASAPVSTGDAAPLTLDASTGLPITDAASFLPPVLVDSSPSFGTVLLWAGLGLFALWVFEEAL